MTEQLPKIPERAYEKVICITEYSKALNEWLIIEYQPEHIDLAWQHYEEDKDQRPIYLLNFGQILATNTEG